MAKHETTIKLKAEDKTGRAFRSAEKGMGKMDKAANNLAGSLRLVSGLLAATGAASIVNGALNSADALAKMSKRLGVSTDRLQELAFASSQSGVAFQTTTASIEKFARNMNDVSQGTGEALDAFKELRIRATNADGTLRDINETFTEAVNKLGQMESGAKKSALAMELFGRGGGSIVQLGKDLNSLSAEAQKLGLILDSKLLAEAEVINDEFDKLSRKVSTLTKDFVLFSAKEIRFAIDPSDQEALSAASAHLVEMQHIAQERAANPLSMESWWVMGIDEEVEKATREVEKYSKRISDAREETKRVAEEAENIEKAFKKANPELEMAARHLERSKLEDTGLEKAVSMATSFADQFQRAVDLQQKLQSNLEQIQGIGEERGDKPKASVLGALTKSSKARGELQKGNVEKASELALEAAKELRQVEEDTGEKVTLAGTFIKNFEKIAKDALDKAEETKEALKLVIVVDGKEQTFDATPEGVKKAGDDTTKRLKAAEKKRA